MKRNITSSVSRIRAVLICTSLLVVFAENKSFAQTLPMPDHIVICIMENHPYTASFGNSSIYGNSAAPYINALAHDSSAANFTDAHAIHHPSQPNYLDLFSGSNQGITDDNRPAGYFTTANLGRQLLDGYFSFVTYSEDLPWVGFDRDTMSYKRKHNPMTNWVGTGTNQIPATMNQPLTAFPSPTGYDSLPTVSYVVPNQDNDMHNGNDPARITVADTWMQNHLDSYIQWAKTHNSLFILTFDEDDGFGLPIAANHIVTIFAGSMVKMGQYSENIDHYTVLRTIEDMYHLPYAGQASGKNPITDCWKAISGLNSMRENESQLKLYPNPATNELEIKIAGLLVERVRIYTPDGQLVSETNQPDNGRIDVSDLAAGIYIAEINAREKIGINKSPGGNSSFYSLRARWVKM